MNSTTEARLKQIMSERNLRQVDILRLSEPWQKKFGISMSKSHLSQYVNGKSQPDQNKLLLLANTLNVSEGWLMGFDVPQERRTGIPNHEPSPDIVPIYNQLHPARQEKVYNYADDQLKQQQKENVISLDDERQKRQPILLHIAGTVSAGTGEYLPDDDTGDDIPFSGPVPDYDFAVRVNGDSMEPMFEDGQIIFVKKCDDCDIHSGQIVIADLNGDAYVKKIDIQPDGVRLISLNPKYKPILVESFDDFAIQGIVML
ncbi:S24 family peptidase [Schleiferilactobacillus harbinensis]|nr:S24 family peptidase [Schleiferilactobacillus harbinensis]